MRVKRHAPLLLLICSVISVPSGATNPIDSLRHQLHFSQDDSIRLESCFSLFDYYWRRDAVLASNYLDTAALQVPASDRPRATARIEYARAALAVRAGEVESAREGLALAKKTFTRIQDTFWLAKTAFKSADLERSRDWEKATNYALEAVTLYQACNKEGGVASAHNMLGVIYKNLEQYDKAYHFYSLALSFYEQSKSHSNTASVLLNLANVASRIDSFDLSIRNFEKALETADFIENSDNLRAYIYNGMSNAYNQTNRYSEALQYGQLAYGLLDESSSPLERSTMLIGLGTNNMQLGKMTEAEKYLIQAASIAEEHTLIKPLERVYESLAKLYAKGNDYGKAYTFLQKHETIEDSTLNRNTIKEIAALEAKFANAQKESKINALNAENAEKELQLTKASRRWYFALLALAALSIIALLMYRQYTIQKRNRAELAAKNKVISTSLADKEMLLKEIHHRVKNNLQVVSSLLNLQSRSIENEEAKYAINEGRNRVKSMALIHQSLYQDDTLVTIDFKEYVVKLVKSLVQSYNLQEESIHTKINIPEANLDVDTVVPLGLIINELISNSLKHAFTGSSSGTISVSLQEEEDHWKLEVADDGSGIPEGQDVFTTGSLGFKLIRAFTAKLKAELSIIRDHGTAVILQFKKTPLSVGSI